MLSHSIVALILVSLQTMYRRSNADISPGEEFYTSKDTKICYLALPHLTVARRLLEPGNGENRISSSSFLLSSARLASNSEKFSWQVPFKLCFYAVAIFTAP